MVDERSREMRRLYHEEDMTLQQIGDRYGVTRERVRQILAEFQPNGKTNREVIAERARRRSDETAAAAAEAAEAEAEQIVHLYRLGFTAVRIAGEIPGATPRSVMAVIRSSLSDLEYKRIRGRKIRAGKQRASEAEMLDNLDRAARELGEYFGYLQFAEWAKREGVVGPQTYIHRFGSWAEARRRVGLPTPSAGVGDRSDKKTREECLAAVRAAVDELGHLPSASEYKRFRTPEMPSLATVRWRLGDGGWAEALAEVAESPSE